MLSVSAAWTRWSGEGKACANLTTPFALPVVRKQVCLLQWLLTSYVVFRRLVVSTLRSKLTLLIRSPIRMRRLKRSEHTFTLSFSLTYFNFLPSVSLCCLTNIFSTLAIPFSPRDTARLIIRKIQFAPSQIGAGPKADICKSFMMSDKPVHLEASLEKDVQ